METITQLPFLIFLLVTIAVLILIRCYLAYKQLKYMENEIYKCLKFYTELHCNILNSTHKKYYLKEFNKLNEENN